LLIWRTSSFLNGVVDDGGESKELTIPVRIEGVPSNSNVDHISIPSPPVPHHSQDTVVSHHPSNRRRLFLDSQHNHSQQLRSFNFVASPGTVSNGSPFPLALSRPLPSGRLRVTNSQLIAFAFPPSGSVYITGTFG
jgi:hypothetical protein